MSKRVGIVTINGLDNYGNLLQNYAVQESLNALGCDAKTIKNTTRYGMFTSRKAVNKFTPKYIYTYIRNQLNYRYNIKNTGGGILKTIKFCKKNSDIIKKAKADRLLVFSNFAENYINWSDETLDINSEWTTAQDSQFDFYVAGSDQVWNPTYPTTSAINFLAFAPERKRISYSASFGINKISDSLKSRYAKWLNGIPYLSVREEQGKKIIKELCGKEATVLCDPTMSLTKEQWLSIAAKPNFNTEEKYILTYFLGDKTKEYSKVINDISARHKLKVINLFDVLEPEYYSVGPREFIYLINNADLVCTDSFHGAVFSILMNTNFITFSRVEDGNSMESRLLTLLNTFGLTERNYKYITEQNIFNTDFSACSDILLKKRNEINQFLISALNCEKTICETKGSNRVLEQKNLCSGCGACAKVCPKNCITLLRDSEGFKYPEIDKNKCIDCKKCETVCPSVTGWLPSKKVGEECFVAYSKNKAIRKNSSSGGVFTHLAEEIINSGGVVFGAAFDGKIVKHTFAETLNELKKFRGSKYVQSEIGDAYKIAEQFLENGRKVFFSGTPCQIKGLYAALGKNDYPNLVTQDLICHGVPSPKVLEAYISYKSSSDNPQVSFRNKCFGWHYFSMKIGSYIKRLDEDWYLKLFLDNTILRPSCYNCSAKTNGSSADITLADCWNPKSVCSDILDDDKGLSLVLINSNEGQALWEKASADLVAFEVDSEKALKSQKALTTSVNPNPKRAAFFDALDICDFEYLYKNWYKKSVLRNIKRNIIFIKTKLKLLLEQFN